VLVVEKLAIQKTPVFETRLIIGILPWFVKPFVGNNNCVVVIPKLIPRSPTLLASLEDDAVHR
jgi:hypothetical protein